MSSLPLRADCLEFFDPILRLPPRPAFPVEKGGGDPRVGQQFGSAHDSLLNMDRRCEDLFDRADDEQIVAEASGSAIADVNLDHCIGAAAGAQHGGLVNPDGAD